MSLFSLLLSLLLHLQGLKHVVQFPENSYALPSLILLSFSFFTFPSLVALKASSFSMQVSILSLSNHWYT